ncbi:unnamed protein product [Heligmosomoides polygyrus]|uniref:Uncharacterized protein n=1 Tax=Heligmosomoides polygyrus TaxID=6339 RepID=A0A183FGJ0_HELPZ|nr:unnamed protein product [Heligmosomoides polygyrus]
MPSFDLMGGLDDLQLIDSRPPPPPLTFEGARRFTDEMKQHSIYGSGHRASQPMRPWDRMSERLSNYQKVAAHLTDE